jgi:hypothetical protein
MNNVYGFYNNKRVDSWYKDTVSFKRAVPVNTITDVCVVPVALSKSVRRLSIETRADPCTFVGLSTKWCYYSVIRRMSNKTETASTLKRAVLIIYATHRVVDSRDGIPETSAPKVVKGWCTGPLTL